MHNSVHTFIESCAKREAPFDNKDIVELGSCDRNGEVRSLFSGARSYLGIDIEAGPGVDLVADVRSWEPDWMYDICVCTSVLEHLERPFAVIDTAAKALRHEGLLLLTTHTIWMKPHAANGSEAWLQGGVEFYHNFMPGELEVFFDPRVWSEYSSMYHEIDYFIMARRNRQ